MQFLDYQNAKGHLEVWKHYPDGTKELHWEEDNVITSGMGATLSKMFSVDKDKPVDDFQIIYFKLGMSGNDVTDPNQVGALQVSSTGDLSGALTAAQYGDGGLSLDVHSLYRNGATEADHVFGVIPYGYIKRVSETKCLWQIVLDEQTANVTDTISSEHYLNEIGLYSNNPFSLTPKASALCAYRYFKPVYKTDAFILVFRWTIDF